MFIWFCSHSRITILGTFLGTEYRNVLLQLKMETWYFPKNKIKKSRNLLKQHFNNKFDDDNKLKMFLDPRKIFPSNFLQRQTF